MWTKNGEYNSLGQYQFQCSLLTFFFIFSLFFEWIKKIWIWPILKVCLGKLNVFLSLYFFCCFFKRTEQGPVQSNKMIPSASNSAESMQNLGETAWLRSVKGWALMLRGVPGHCLLGLQILGQQRVTLWVCVFQFVFCITDTKETAILAYACIVQGRS